MALLVSPESSHVENIHSCTLFLWETTSWQKWDQCQGKLSGAPGLKLSSSSTLISFNQGCSFTQTVGSDWISISAALWIQISLIDSPENSLSDYCHGVNSQAELHLLRCHNRRAESISGIWTNDGIMAGDSRGWKCTSRVFAFCYLLLQFGNKPHNPVSMFSYRVKGLGVYEKKDKLEPQKAAPRGRIKWNQHLVWSESVGILWGILMHRAVSSVHVTQCLCLLLSEWTV